MPIDPFDTQVLTVAAPITAKTFRVDVQGSSGGPYGGGNIYRRRFGGAIETPGSTPWAQNSFKQQLHEQGNYRAPFGIAGILDGADSQHVWRSCHPTCGFYPDAQQPEGGYNTAITRGPHTYLSNITGGSFQVGDLVSFTNAGGNAGAYLDTRLFKLAAPMSSYQFELVDPLGRAIDSSNWSTINPANVQTMRRQFVAGGSDATKGGFGIRIVVSTQAGCDVSEYGLHHEPGQAGDTTWWGSIDGFEFVRDAMLGPGPVLLTDCSFKEAAAHGRGGFLLAQADGISSLTMLGGAITLAHPQMQFGSTTQADKLLMATGTGASPWALANTDLVVEDARLVDISKLAGFSGRLTAQDAAFAAGVTAVYPGTAAVIHALSGRPLSEIRLLAPLLDAMLIALDRAGVLAKLDALHVFATANEAAARVNLAKPVTGPLTIKGTGTPPAFAAWLGYTGTGPTGPYFQSPIVPTSQTQYGQQQATMAVVSRSTDASASINRDVSLDGSNYAYIDPWSGLTPAYRIKANGSVDTTAVPGVASSLGFFAWSRTTMTTGAKYYGAGTTAQPAAITISLSSGPTLPTSGFEVLRDAAHQVSAAVFGRGLTQAEMNALYAALKTYLTTVGAWL